MTAWRAQRTSGFAAYPLRSLARVALNIDESSQNGFIDILMRRKWLQDFGKDSKRGTRSHDGRSNHVISMLTLYHLGTATNEILQIYYAGHDVVTWLEGICRVRQGYRNSQGSVSRFAPHMVVTCSCRQRCVDFDIDFSHVCKRRSDQIWVTYGKISYRWSTILYHWCAQHHIARTTRLQHSSLDTVKADSL